MSNFSLLLLCQVNCFNPSQNSKAETLTKEVSLDDVEDAIKESKNDKSHGFDGLTPDFYKAVSDMLVGDLVEVINDQLARLVLMESDIEGAMRLISKVEGVPLVTELRPITLLNTS